MGGLRQTSNGIEAIIPGDQFVEPLSNRCVRVNGAAVLDTEVLPSGGGYQTLLDATVLACETKTLEALRHYKDTLSGQQDVLLFIGINCNFTS